MKLLILTYHYIGDEDAHQRGIYPVSPQRLMRQLDALADKKWQFISDEELSIGISGKLKLPEKSCLVTFDDALRSQYTMALPILAQRGIPAVFFVPTQHIVQKQAYAVHKIHYLLHKIPITELLAEFERSFIEAVDAPFDWSGAGKITSQAIRHYRYDDAQTACFKFFINHIMSKSAVDKVVHNLFSRFYIDEAAWCDSWYISAEEIRRLQTHNLFSVAMHTHSHSNIAQESEEVFTNDMIANQSVLFDLFGIKPKGIAYPFGSVTTELFEQKIKQGVESLGLAYGLTTERKINADFNNPFLLGRFSPEDIVFGKRPMLEI